MRYVVFIALFISFLMHCVLFYGLSDTVLFDMGAYEEKIKGMLQVDIGERLVQMVTTVPLDESVNSPEDTDVLRKTADEIIDRKHVAERMSDEPQSFTTQSVSRDTPMSTDISFDTSVVAPHVSPALPQSSASGSAHLKPVPAHLAALTNAVSLPSVHTVKSQPFATVVVKDTRDEEDDRALPTFVAAASPFRPTFFVEEDNAGNIIKPTFSNALTFQSNHLPIVDSMSSIGVPKGEMRVRGDLSRYVDVACEVLRLPNEVEQYVRIRVSPKPAAERFPLPKDVLFLIDVSGSITLEDIMRVKFDVWNSLAALNPADRFNIILFSVTQQKLYDDFRTITPESMREGQQFIERLAGSRETNIYDALMQVVPFLKQEDRVVHIVLMSDAKPTDGERDFRRIINDFTRNRVGNVAFFTFDVGSVKKQFLLDYLAYENRGVAFHDSEDLQEAYHLDLLMRTFSEPVLYDIRVDSLLLEDGELFPRLLPHLYAGESIDIVARMPHDSAFACEVSAKDVHGERLSLQLGVNTHGYRVIDDLSLMDEWAHFKLFELISIVFREGMTTDMEKEIAVLKKRYGITIPRELSRYLR